jgi:hypothetical protein
MLQPWKIYLAKLKRLEALEGLPTTVFKVGITSSSDAMKRLSYRGADEPNPIIETFHDIKVMHSVWASSREEAEQIEQSIMKDIAGNGYFHNWREPSKLSGITEMRTWNYDEVQKVIALMNKLGKSFNDANKPSQPQYID